MRCDYQITEMLDNGENRLRCRRCGDETSSRYPPEKVHTICGSTLPPTAAELIERVRADAAERHFDELTAMLPEIARRVVICHSNPCGLFNKHVCTDRGSGCTHWKRWMERILIGQCDHWNQ